MSERRRNRLVLTIEGKKRIKIELFPARQWEGSGLRFCDARGRRVYSKRNRYRIRVNGKWVGKTMIDQRPYHACVTLSELRGQFWQLITKQAQRI